jgi:hypothetical protein
MVLIMILRAKVLICDGSAWHDPPVILYAQWLAGTLLRAIGCSGSAGGWFKSAHQSWGVLGFVVWKKRPKIKCKMIERFTSVSPP